MPEAVIVATARSPIGRAFKGSLVDFRPDDITATIVKAALDKVPEEEIRRHVQSENEILVVEGCRILLSFADHLMCHRPLEFLEIG